MGARAPVPGRPTDGWPDCPRLDCRRARWITRLPQLANAWVSSWSFVREAESWSTARSARPPATSTEKLFAFGRAGAAPDAPVDLVLERVRKAVVSHRAPRADAFRGRVRSAALTEEAHIAGSHTLTDAHPTERPRSASAAMAIGRLVVQRVHETGSTRATRN